MSRFSPGVIHMKYWLKHSIGADLIFFLVISMLQKNCVIKEHFIKVMQKGIVRSCLPKNFKLLTLSVLEILSIIFKAPKMVIYKRYAVSF